MDLTALFDAHHEALFRYLVRFCGDRDLAADAAQEAFVRVIERPPPEGVSRAWLFRVATNAAMESARTQGRRQRLANDAPLRVPMADPARDPHERLESEELRQRVGSALQTLPEKQRTAALMREEGFSHREIAEALNTTVGSVGALLARALEKLARELELVPDDGEH